jgi:hypothetical protein
MEKDYFSIGEISKIKGITIKAPAVFRPDRPPENLLTKTRSAGTVLYLSQFVYL